MNVTPWIYNLRQGPQILTVCKHGAQRSVVAAVSQQELRAYG